MDYCTYCGQQQGRYPTGFFNRADGQPEMTIGCVNLKCERGCGNRGHQWGFFRGSCKRCGFGGYD